MSKVETPKVKPVKKVKAKRLDFMKDAQERIASYQGDAPVEKVKPVKKVKKSPEKKVKKVAKK